MEIKWDKLVYKIEEFMYGNKGIVTTAYSDRNLETYYWDMDKIIEILKDIKNLQENFSQEQLTILQRYKKTFTNLATEENNIKQMQNEILIIYDNIDEY